jgi:N-acetylglucosaminyldiphosphoundecaprenol N-acetyl-beta-D-mannosaminyltransferase
MTDLRARSAPIPTVRVAGVDIAAVPFDEAVDAVLGLVGNDCPSLVVTPNVDHLVLLEHDHEFATAYDAAALRFTDGAPIVLLTRLVGTPVPQRVAGIDLTVALLAACERDGRSVYFFGGAPDHLERAVAQIRADHPDLDIVGASAPVVDLDAPSESELLALAECRRCAPDLLFAFLGAPKQERWFLRRRAQLPPTVVLGVGGSVDFLAGALRRAPGWVQAIGCEWLWRLAHEPRRLFPRYVVRDSRFLLIAARTYRDHLRERRARHRRDRAR